MFRSLLALTGLALSLAGIGLFLGLGIWVWALRAEVGRQADVLAQKAETAAAAADHAVGFVREVVGKAHEELAVARAATATPPEVSPLVVMTARKASQDLAGSVERAHGAVVAASDAVLVADAALEVFNDDLSIKRMFGVDPKQVGETKDMLGSVGYELRQARSVLGMPVPSSGKAATPEQLNAVDRALGQARGFTDSLEKVVVSARQRVADTRRGVEVWAWRVALATSVACALALLGQFFLARFCLRVVRRKPA